MFRPFDIAGQFEELPVAVHESGHAVIHHGMGCHITGASIDQDGIPGFGGFVALVQPGQTSPTLAMISTAAGPIAAFRLFGLPVELDDAELAAAFSLEARGDAFAMARAARYLEQKHPGTTAELHFRHGLAQAAEMIARPTIWHAIMDLAALLIRRRAEYGTAIHEHLERHIPFGSLATPFSESHYGETTHS